MALTPGFFSFVSRRKPAAQGPRLGPQAASLKPPVFDPLVRTRPEKYGGAIAPEATDQALAAASSLKPQLSSPPAPSVAVPVKAHVRNVPAHPAEEKRLFAERVTLDMIVAEFRRSQRITTQRVLLLGAMCEPWIREQLVERTALDRATAIKKIREELCSAKLEKKEARVDLFVRCHWVAVLLGGWRDDSEESRVAANTLAFSALRLFPILIERDKADRWQLSGKYAEAAKTLWNRAVKERLSADVVNDELRKIVPARTISIQKHRPVKLKFLVKLFPRLPIADVPAAIAELQAIQRQSVLPSEAKSA